MKSIIAGSQVKNRALMLITLFLSLFIVGFNTSAQNEFNFVVSEPGSVPYIYSTKGVYVGIIPEVLKGLIDSFERLDLLRPRSLYPKRKSTKLTLASTVNLQVFALKQKPICLTSP